MDNGVTEGKRSISALLIIQLIHTKSMSNRSVLYYQLLIFVGVNVLSSKTWIMWLTCEYCYMIIRYLLYPSVTAYPVTTTYDWYIMHHISLVTILIIFNE